jgi:hypothetical protein
MLFWITLLVAYAVWTIAVAIPLTWKQGAVGEVIDFGDVLTAQGRQVWKLLTLPATVAKRRRERKLN